MANAPEASDADLPLFPLILRTAKIVQAARKKQADERLEFLLLPDGYSGHERGPISDLLAPESGASADARIWRFARVLELWFNPLKADEAQAVFKGTGFDQLMQAPKPSPGERDTCGLKFVVDQEPGQQREHFMLFEQDASLEQAGITINSGHDRLASFHGSPIMVNECLACLRQALFPEMPALKSWEGQSVAGDCASCVWVIPRGPRSIRSL